MSDHIKYFPALYVCDWYLCLVFAASAFKCLVAEVGYGNETCLLYTSDAADDMQCVDLGGRRIIKKI
mgnify:CR=1 FL=1